jgi:hypothetical protein
MKHDLRANAFRVCREEKSLHTFPDRALDIPIFAQAFEKSLQEIKGQHQAIELLRLFRSGT